MDEINNKLDKIMDEIKSQLIIHPWSEMSQTSAGKTSNARKCFFKEYNLEHSKAVCMLTGITPDDQSNHLRVAHIMPRSAQRKFLDSITMKRNDIDSIRNLLLLCRNIEIAFDRLEISFIPSKNPFAGQFCLRIWNDRTRNTPIYDGSEKVIGDYDGAILNFTVNGKLHCPYKRALSYQAYHAYNQWSMNNGSVYEGSLREEFFKLVGRHINEEVSDDDDEDDAI